MKTLALSLIVLVGGVGFSAGSSQHSPAKDRVHMDWLLDRIDEAKSVEEGMCIEDLMKVFRLEAGLQSGDIFGPPFVSRSFNGFFSLRSCEFIKLDVDFEIPEGIDLTKASRENVKIRKLSRPYLNYARID